ncbi:HdeD family acid-resistance protein [Streptomyces sp. NPDC002519]
MTTPHVTPSVDPRGERNFSDSANGSAMMRVLAASGWQMLLAAGVAAFALGVVVLVWPGATLTVAGALFGVALLASGVFQLGGAFAHHVPGHLRALGVISGALSVFLGLLCFRGPAQSVLLLALWIGFGWLMRGIMAVSVAISTHDLPARGWHAFLGVVSALAGILLIVWPFGSIATLTLWTGIWLVVLGAAEAVHAVVLRVRTR